jgi:2-polyprenyl-3-methyl-5-hydroxy-6-metoxy-1,4-benzoquinol methylase
LKLLPPRTEKQKAFEMRKVESLFEYRNCPSCGQDDFEVLFDSNMEPDDFNVLFDYSMEGHDSQEGEEGYLIPGKQWGRHVKCRNCHLIYMNPIEKVSKTNEYYHSAKNSHAPTIRASYLRTAKSQVSLVRKHASGGSLLDIGCAQGFFLFTASQAGYKIKGIEISQDAAEYARREFGLDVEPKAFEELRFPENHFDVVTLWQVLEHVPYPLSVLEEVHRILKPDGLVVVSTPNIEGLPSRLLRKKWWDIKRLHVNQFSTRTLMDILRNAEFKNISPASYKGFISLSILLTMMLKYIDAYERLKGLFNAGSISGKILNKVMLIYPSGFNHCVVLAYK